MLALLPLSRLRHRVLVAEDNYVIAEDLRAGLDAAGVDVLGPVPDLQGAVDLLAREPALDAAILDVSLGRELVYPLADTLGAQGIPFIFATGREASEVPAAYAEVPRCEKPYDAERCLELLFGHAAAARGDGEALRLGVSQTAHLTKARKVEAPRLVSKEHVQGS